MASISWLEELAALIGTKDPRVRRLVENAKRYPRARESAERLLLAMCRRQGIDLGEEPVFDVPAELSEEGILLGDVLRGDHPAGKYRHPLSELGGHIGVFGTTGSGKTSLVAHLCEHWMRAGLRVIILDVAGEYGWLAGLFPADELLLLNARTFPLALFENPPGSCLDDLARLSQVVGVLREGLYLRDGSCNLLLKTVGDLYRERGVLDGSRDYPLAADVFQALITRKFSAQSRHAGYLETLVNRFHGLLQSFPGMNAKRSAVPAELLRRSAVISLADLSPGEIEVFTGLLLSYVACSIEGSLQRETSLVMVLEEAHLEVSRQKMQRFDLGEPIAVRSLRTARKYGLGLVVVDQVPSELPAAVLGNLGTRIVFRLTNHPCVRAVAYSMGLDRAQETALAELPRRRAVVQTASIPTPFLLQVLELRPREYPSRGELEQRRRESLELLDYEMPAEDVRTVLLGKAGPAKPAASETEIRGRMHKVLARICEFPCELIPERCEVLGMERAEEYRARQALEKLGLIELGDKVGARWQLYVPTAKGVAWAERLGVPVRRFKSGVGHEFMVRRVQQALQRSIPQIRFLGEGKGIGIGRVQPDLLAAVRWADGAGPLTVAVQVSSTNTARYEADRGLELAGIEYVDRVIIVARNKGARAAVVRALDDAAAGRTAQEDSENGAGRGARGKIAVLDFDTCLAPGFDWVALLGEDTGERDRTRARVGGSGAAAQPETMGGRERGTPGDRDSGDGH